MSEVPSERVLLSTLQLLGKGTPAQPYQHIMYHLELKVPSHRISTQISSVITIMAMSGDTGTACPVLGMSTGSRALLRPNTSIPDQHLVSETAECDKSVRVCGNQRSMC